MIENLFSNGVPAGLTDTAALAAVALVGYLFGQRSRKRATELDEQLGTELSRAAAIAQELQQIAQRIRQDVAAHQGNIAAFSSRVQHLQNGPEQDGWHALSTEAESLLSPTMKLATNLSLAYDQLRKQSTQLMNFTESRYDPMTGIYNRRAFEEQLIVEFELCQSGGGRFSVALFTVAKQDGSVPDSALLAEFARTVDGSRRQTDVAARYSGDEFVALMRQTSLAGATVFSERLLRKAVAELGLKVYGGVVEVVPNDTPEKLLSRADSALYSARTCGRTCLFQHNGSSIRVHDLDLSELVNDVAEPADVEDCATAP